MITQFVVGCHSECVCSCYLSNKWRAYSTLLFAIYYLLHIKAGYNLKIVSRCNIANFDATIVLMTEIIVMITYYIIHYINVVQHSIYMIYIWQDIWYIKTMGKFWFQYFFRVVLTYVLLYSRIFLLIDIYTKAYPSIFSLK